MALIVPFVTTLKTNFSNSRRFVLLGNNPLKAVKIMISVVFVVSLVLGVNSTMNVSNPMPISVATAFNSDMKMALIKNNSFPYSVLLVLFSDGT